MKSKPLAYFLCAVTLLLIAVSPLIITTFFSEPVGEKKFEGILELWHISDWDTAGSSKQAFLAKQLKRFESANPHVFIRMTILNAVEAAGKINEGILPDLISYPGTFLADFENKMPYMYGAYYIFVNNETADDNGILLPGGFGLDSDMFKDLGKLGLVFDAEQGYSALPAIALHEAPEPPRPEITTWPQDSVTETALDLNPKAYFDGLELFLDGEACMMIASQHQLFEAQQGYEQNDGPAFSVYTVSGYTDMVQYISALPSEDRLRQEMSMKFAELLLSAKAQQSLYALGVFPAVSNIKIYEEDDVNAKIYQLLTEKPAITEPGEQDLLNDLALRSFSGDRSAYRELKRRLQS